MAPSDPRSTEKGPENPDKSAGKLGGVPPLAHDPDERPTREDRQGHGSIFNIPVPLPRFLRPRGKRD